MSSICLGTSYHLKVKTKYNDNGTIKTASRAISPQKDGQINYDNTFENISNVEDFMAKYQKITTDTLVGFQLTFTEEYIDENGYGAPGTTNAAWDNFEDVKLINSYTDGDETAKETIKRVATAATELDLKQYGRATAKLGVNGTTAISGYYTGSTVDSAWRND